MDTQKMNPTKSIRPDDLWANYDDLDDSLIVYTTGKPVPSIVLWVDEYTSLLMSEDDKSVVGFQIDNFERAWLPAHADVATAWKNVRPSLSDGWNAMLRVLASFLLVLLSTDDQLKLSPA